MGVESKQQEEMHGSIRVLLDYKPREEIILMRKERLLPRVQRIPMGT